MWFLVGLAAARSIWPMTFEQCAVTVRDQRWDFTATEYANRLFNFSEADMSFYWKLCKPIPNEDVPFAYNRILCDRNVIRCDATMKCTDISSIYHFEWAPLNDSDLRKGISFSSRGEPVRVNDTHWDNWQTRFEFRCDETNEDKTPVVTIDRAAQRLNVVWSNKDSCPSEFNGAVVHPMKISSPGVPTSPRPTPAGNERQKHKISAEVNGERIRFNLRWAKSVTKTLNTTDLYAYKAEIHYSPWKLTGCPKNAECPDPYTDDQANIWKCVGRYIPQCFPIGDRRYGLDLHVTSYLDEYAGFTAIYNGSAGHYTQTYIQFSCDENLRYNEIEFDQITAKQVIYARARNVCPGVSWITWVVENLVWVAPIFLVVVVVPLCGFYIYFKDRNKTRSYFGNGDQRIDSTSEFTSMYTDPNVSCDVHSILVNHN